MSATPVFPGLFARATRTPPRDACERAFRDAHPLANEMVGDAWIDYRKKWREEFGRLASEQSPSRVVLQRVMGTAVRATQAVSVGLAVIALAMAGVLVWTGADAFTDMAQNVAELPSEAWSSVVKWLMTVAVGFALTWQIARYGLLMRSPVFTPQERMRQWAESYWTRRCGVEVAYRPFEEMGQPRDPSWDEPRPRWTEEALRGWGPEASELPYRYLVSYVYSWDSAEGAQRACSVAVARGQAITSLADIAAITTRLEADYGKHGRHAFVVITGWTPFEPPGPPPKSREPVPMPSDLVCTIVDLASRRSRAA